MGQAKLVTSDAVGATDHLLEVGRRIMADGRITPSEQTEWNVAADDCHGKVINVHWRVKLLSLFTRDVQDIRNYEETAARANVPSGIRLLDPVTPLDAA